MNNQAIIMRPLIPAVFFYVIGIIIERYVMVESNVLFVTILLTLIMGIVMSILSLFKRFQFIILIGLFMMLGMLNANMAVAVPNEWSALDGQNADVLGTVVSVEKEKETYTSYSLDDVIVNGQACKGKVIAFIFYDEDETRDCIELGTRIKINTIIEQPNQARNPHLFDYREYLRRRGIYAQIAGNRQQYNTVDYVSVGLVKSMIEKSQMLVSDIINEWVRGEEAGVVIGMLIGDKTGIAQEVEESFKTNGIAHILAISGLHVGFLVAFVLALLKACHLRKGSQFIMTTLVLIGYCMLTGAHASTIRATIMAVVILGGYCLGRRADSVNSVALAALIILLFKPLDLFDVGFQLSFLAVLGIVLFARRMANCLGFMPKIISQSIAVVIAAQIGTMPVMAYHFNTLSVMAFFANIPFVFLAGIIVTLSFTLVIFSLVPFINALLGIIIKSLVHLLTSGSNMLSQIAWAECTVCSPTIIILVGIGLLAWLLSRECPKKLVKWRYQLSMVIVLLLVIWTYSEPYINHNAQMVVLDVGQGDAIHIQTPDNKNILVDTGGMEEWYTGNFEPGEDVVVPYFLKSGIKTIDLLILTHAHADHIGGVPAVIKSLNVKNLVVAEADWYTEKLVGYNGEIIEVETGDIVHGKASNLTVMNPMRETMGEGDNNDSIVFTIEMNGVNLLLTGDSETEVCTNIAPYIDAVNIIKVPHHGGNSSMSQAYFNHVNAQIAIVSCGEDNRYGHPHENIVDAYIERGTAFYRTDQQGAVRVTIKPSQTILVKTMIH